MINNRKTVEGRSSWLDTPLSQIAAPQCMSVMSTSTYAARVFCAAPTSSSHLERVCMYLGVVVCACLYHKQHSSARVCAAPTRSTVHTLNADGRDAVSSAVMRSGMPSNRDPPPVSTTLPTISFRASASDFSKALLETRYFVKYIFSAMNRGADFRNVVMRGWRGAGAGGGGGKGFS